MNETNNERIRIGLRVTIRRRGKKGTYVADFHFDGEHRRKSLATNNKKLAKERAIAIEYGLTNGTFEMDDRPTKSQSPDAQIRIEAVCRDYIAFLTTEGRRSKTVTKYKGILRIFAELTAEIGIYELNEVDLILVDKYRAIRRPLLSEKSMHHEGSLLKRLFAWAVERNLMATNPLASRVFKAPKSKPRGGPTLEQINTVLAGSSKARHPIIAVAAFAGMRIGEVTRLRVEDVDFENNWIHIVSRPGLETKSGDTWKVPIHPRLRMILEKIPRNKTGWFFTAQPSRKYPLGGHHINPKHVNGDFIKILKQLGIPSGRESGYTFHSLRASFKTICINSGIPKEVVDIWQNHAPDRSASHVYYKLTDEESQRLILKAQFGDE